MSIDIYPPVTATPVSSVPSGAVMDFAGLTAPSGWLLCDGSVVSRTTYAALFAVIGTAYGAGDGSTTFSLPDARSRVVVGAGTGTGLATRSFAGTGGAEAALLPTHDHGGATGNDTVGGQDGAGQHVHSGTTADIDRGHTHGFNATNITWAGTGSGSVTRLANQGVAAATSGENTGHLHAFTSGGRSNYHGHPVTAAGVAATDGRMPPFLALNKIIKV